MKYFIAILSILCIAGAIFTTLYFTNPRVVIDEVGIPEYIYVESEPMPPDTVYIMQHTTEYDTVWELLAVSRPEQRIYISEKRFTMNDLLASVTSNVTVYGEKPADLVENNITIIPNQEELGRRVSSATSASHKKGMKTGLLIGAGAAAAIIVATMVIGK